MTVVNVNKHKGFSIVELLVVIVVIAILSTITIVSYTGITERSESSAQLATTKSWHDLIAVNYAEKGVILKPTVTAGPAYYNCLGQVDDYPAVADFPAGVCLVVNSVPAQNGTSNFNYGTFDQYVIDALVDKGTVPSSKLFRPISFKKSENGYTYTYKIRGPMVLFAESGTEGVSISIVWFAKNASGCGRANVNLAFYSGLTPPEGDIVNCSYRIGDKPS